MFSRKLYQWLKKESKKWAKAGLSRHFCDAVTVFSRGVARSKSSHIRQISRKEGVTKAASARRRLQRFVGTKGDLDTFFTRWPKTVIKKMPAKEPLIFSVDGVKIKNHFGVLVVGLTLI